MVETSSKTDAVSYSASSALLDAIDAVLRDALDRVEVHPCDYDDDTVRANGLLPEMKKLYLERRKLDSI